MDEKALNKELVKFAGWRNIRIVPAVFPKESFTIRGQFNGEDVMCWALTQSLDACFKWLIKPLKEKLGEKEYFKFLTRWSLYMEDGREALALCLAIEKLIDGGFKV